MLHWINRNKSKCCVCDITEDEAEILQISPSTRKFCRLHFEAFAEVCDHFWNKECVDIDEDGNRTRKHEGCCIDCNPTCIFPICKCTNPEWLKEIVPE